MRQRECSRIFDRAAATYRKVGPDQFGYFAELLVERVGVPDDADILDVATGNGAVLAAAGRRQRGRGRLVGIDRSAAMLARAERELGELDVQLFELDAQDLDLPRDSFDVVLCSFGLQSVDSRDRALLGFARVTRPGGRLGIVYPRGWHFLYDARWRWQADLFREYGADIGMVETEAAELNDLVEHAGFERVRIEEVPYQLVFRGEEEWWSWSWSHGTRALFEAVPTSRIDALRRELAHGLRERCTGADGSIRGSLSAFVITAEKPIREPTAPS
jgi:SAM-dependent methyltransferase